MKHNASLKLAPSITDTLERCQDAIKQNFEEKAQLSFAYGAKVIGIHFSTLHLWQKQGKIPSLKEGTRRWITRENCEEIKAAMESHGSKWFEYMSDEFKSQIEVEPDESEEIQVPSSDRERWIKLTLDKAKSAHEAGKYEASSHLFMLFMDAAEENLVDL